jgi:lipid-A-disaccharide synthase
VRFLVACLRPDQADRVRRETAGCCLPLEVCSGKTPEVMRLAHSCLAVSGSVSLELMYHRKPTVIVYRIGWALMGLARLLATTKYITLVNIMAGREVFPEYPTTRCEAPAVSGHILRWLSDPAAYEAVRGTLGDLNRRVAAPGACGRAAEVILRQLSSPSTPQAA